MSERINLDNALLTDVKVEYEDFPSVAEKVRFDTLQAVRAAVHFVPDITVGKATYIKTRDLFTILDRIEKEAADDPGIVS